MNSPLILLDINESMRLLGGALGLVLTITGFLLVGFYKDTKSKDEKLSEELVLAKQNAALIKEELIKEINLNKKEIEKEVYSIKAEIATHRLDIQDRLNVLNINLLNRMDEIKNKLENLRK